MVRASLSAMFVLFCSAIVCEASAPRLVRLDPPGGQRGTTVEVQLLGRYLDDPQEVVFYEPGITVESIEMLDAPPEEPRVEGRRGGGGRRRLRPDSRVKVKLKVAENCQLGPHGVRLRTAGGLTEYQRFFVGPFPQINEDEQRGKPNDKPETAKELKLNSTVFGRMNEQSDVDLYRIDSKKGDRISAEIESARIGVERGIPDLHVTVLDANGKEVAEADDSALFVQDPVLSIIADRDGPYYIQVRHSLYNASNELYLLHVGNFPRPTGFYPAGGQAGTEVALQVLGDPRGAWKTTVRLPTDPLGDFAFSVVDPDSHVTAPSPNTLRVSPFPNVLETEPNETPESVSGGTVAELPVAFNGIIERAGDVDCFRFKAKKGERYKIHALANAIGSPLDATLWIKTVGGKSNNPIARANDSRLNQLGLAPTPGMMRETLDPLIEFTVPADGEYVIGIEDERNLGGADFVYRIECQPESDAVVTYIPVEPENRFMPQMRQVIAVPAGNRYNTQVAISNTNRPFNGDLELVAVGLPEGVTMSAPHLSPGVSRVPVVFTATKDAKLQAKFIDIQVRPVAKPDAAAKGDAVAKTDAKEASPSKEATGPKEVTGAKAAGGAKETTAAAAVPAASLPGGYRQVITMNQYGNNDFYSHIVIEKLLLAVTEPAEFTVSVDEPKTSLVQNGEMSLKCRVERAKGFEGPVTISLEWKPNGVSVATPLTIPADKTEGEYLLGASRGATAGTYQLAVTAINGGARANYYDTSDRTYIASPPFALKVTEPNVEGKLARISIERNKTAALVCKLNQLKPFEGTAKATLGRLPRGVELVEPFREFTSKDKEITFTLRATDDCLVGTYQGIVLDVTVLEEGQPTRQLSGYGMLRIEPERGPRVTAK